ncbi:biopolymer transporter ExbD [Pontimicrobium aquaticum]|uniref:Biopolymer transporter ExbD n=1 Tax=Pontimicrobium aquaticum TaxID=2565367 RepID=A0A4U0EPE2_9FLAO|nr:biopolymer transporter ExbD [Pontimicrobium aquaticum]
MADIAFLLLIFFLVTTTIASEQGIQRKLPKICENDCIIDVNERNILRISINGKQEIMVQNEITSVDKLKGIAKTFIDNNGVKLETSSDNPTKAVISLQSHPQSSYELFIKVQDELSKAYYELRTDYARNVLGKSLEELNKSDKILLKNAYPFIISEAQTK